MNTEKNSNQSKKDTIPPHVGILYQARFDHLIFMKRQQWAITNYLLLVLAAIYFLTEGFVPAPTCLERLIFTGLTAIAAGAGIYLLWRIQDDMNENRKATFNIEAKNFTLKERENFGLSTESNYRIPCGSYFIVSALTCVSLAGAFLVLWNLWRPVAC